MVRVVQRAHNRLQHALDLGKRRMVTTQRERVDLFLNAYDLGDAGVHLRDDGRRGVAICRGRRQLLLQGRAQVGMQHHRVRALRFDEVTEPEVGFRRGISCGEETKAQAAQQFGLDLHGQRGERRQASRVGVFRLERGQDVAHRRTFWARRMASRARRASSERSQ